MPGMTEATKADQFPNPFSVGLTCRARKYDAAEWPAPFVSNEKVIAGAVRSQLNAGRATGDELATTDVGITEAVQVQIHSVAEGLETIVNESECPRFASTHPPVSILDRFSL
jgi:hypothetical protein